MCVVEWSENVSDALEGALTVSIEKLGDTRRNIILEGGEYLADLGL